MSSAARASPGLNNAPFEPLSEFDYSSDSASSVTSSEDEDEPTDAGSFEGIINEDDQGDSKVDLTSSAADNDFDTKVVGGLKWVRQGELIVPPPNSAQSSSTFSVDNIGPIPAAADARSALQHFRLFIPDSMMKQFVHWTNHSEESVQSNEQGDLDSAEQSHIKPWANTTCVELDSFIAVQIFMGIVLLPRTKMYWSDEFGQDFVRHTMTRDRFEQLKCRFRVTSGTVRNDSTRSSAAAVANSLPGLVNNRAHAAAVATYAVRKRKKKTNPVGYVAELCVKLNEAFGSRFVPDRELAIDESMIDFQGAATIRQYIPGKPHPWGYKLFCLVADSYLLAFEIYEGKSSQSATFDVQALVKRLIGRYKNLNHTVFMDSFFSSIKLTNDLEQMKVFSCCSVQSNRVGLPKPALLNKKPHPKDPLSLENIKKMERGDFLLYRAGNLYYAIIKDKKIVRLLFNHASGSNRTMVEFHEKKTNTMRVRSVPQALVHYRKYARGVDVVNQLHYNYIIGRKSHSSWSRLVWWLIELCILDAYFIWRPKGLKRNHLQFRISLMHELTNSTNSSFTNTQRSRSLKRQYAASSSWHNQHVLTVARACHIESCPTRTVKTCKECSEGAPKPIHLCSLNCWNAFHSPTD